MKKIKIIFASILVFNCSSIFAEQVTPIAVGCDTVSGECFVILESPFQSGTAGCANKNQLRMNPDNKGTQGQYSAALAAFMSGKKLEAGSTSCLHGITEPSFLYIIK